MLFMMHAIRLTMTISAAQSRAARGLLNWTQQRLAEASGVSQRAINRFEAESSQPIPANRAMIEQALRAAGIEFIENGVRLRQSA